MGDVPLGTAEGYLRSALDLRRYGPGDAANTNALVGIGVALCEIRDLLKQTLTYDHNEAKEQRLKNFMQGEFGLHTYYPEDE